MNQRNPGVELSKRNQSETAVWREEMLATQWLSGRNSAPDCFTSVELRLGPGQSGNRGHLDPNQGAACMSIAKWTLALKIPEFLELLKLGMVFQPQRIFQPQNEQPELCQSVIPTFASHLGGCSIRCMSSSMAKCQTSSQVPDGSGWSLSPGNLN